MTKLQLISIFSCLGIFLVLYFGCELTPPEQKKVEKKNILAMESTNITTLLKDASAKLEANQISAIEYLDAQVEAANDTTKVELLKQLSGKWYEFGHPAIAGFYAQAIAESSEDENSWSIAGTTYGICVKSAREQKINDYCFKRAIQSFENAVSLNPENPQHKVNLAVLYTDRPPKENPMKGVLMLRDLVDKYPENASVLTNLGRLAIKTSQFEKAIERLSQALALEPNNRQGICLIAQAYEAVGDKENAEVFAKKCNQGTVAK